MNDSYVVSDDVFFVVHDNTFVAWNYQEHEQFALSLDCLRVLLDSDFRAKNAAITRELTKAKILVSSDSRRRRTWGWDLLSKIFHIGTSRTRPDGFDVTCNKASLAYVEYCTS